MSKKQALVDKYSTKYGVSRKIVRQVIESGLKQGLDLKAVEVGIRMTLGAMAGGNKEFFTVEDVMAATGETRESIISRIEEMKTEMLQSGVDSSEYFIEVKPQDEMH